MSIISDIKTICKVFRLCNILAKNNALFLIEDIDSLALPKFTSYIFWNNNKSPKPKRLSNAISNMPITIIAFVEFIISKFEIKDIRLDFEKIEIEPSNNFKKIYKKPLNIDSISTCYKAITNNKEEVLVKILNSDLEKQYYDDIKILYWLATQITKEDSPLNNYNLTSLVKEFDVSYQKKLDLRFEAADISNSYYSKIKTPIVIWGQTDKEIMVLKNYDDYFKIKPQPISKLKKINKNISGVGFVFEATNSRAINHSINPEDIKYLLNRKDKCQRKNAPFGCLTMIILILVILYLSK